MESVVFQTVYMLQCYCLSQGADGNWCRSPVQVGFGWAWKLEEEVRYSHSQVDAGIQCEFSWETA